MIIIIIMILIILPFSMMSALPEVLLQMHPQKIGLHCIDADYLDDFDDYPDDFADYLGDFKDDYHGCNKGQGDFGSRIISHVYEESSAQCKISLPTEQARKPRSYASLKLCPGTHRRG